MKYKPGVSKIARILRSEWNPIGGDDLPSDEYDSYAPQIYGMIVRGEGAGAIAGWLAEIEEDILGRIGDAHDLLPVAQRLLAETLDE